LWPAVKALLDEGLELHALRDATRGGLAALLNEWANSSEVCIEIEEENIPVSESLMGTPIFSARDNQDSSNCRSGLSVPGNLV
jgi:thiamine monophosphate kinase